MKRKGSKCKNEPVIRKNNQSVISRRTIVAGAVLAGVGAAVSLPGVAKSQSFKELKKFYLGSKKVSLTISWLAQGNTSYSFITKEKGFWKERGIDVDISRGFGSTASIQVMGAGKFDFGLAAAPAIILGATRGLKLRGLGPVSYDTPMGIGFLAESSIKTPKDLEGKKLGLVPTSVEVPFLPAYAKRAGLDLSKVTIVHMDNKVLEQALIQGSVDAITGVATSSVPKFVARDVPIRFMLFQDAGFSMYSQTIVSQPRFVEKEPQLIQDFVDGLFEGIKFTLLNPEESLEIFLKLVPEHGLTEKSRKFTKLGFGMWQMSLVTPETKSGGLGWADPKKLTDMTDLITEFVADKGAPRPDPNVLFTNKFSGNVKLTDAEWAQVEKNVAPYREYVRPV